MYSDVYIFCFVHVTSPSPEHTQKSQVYWDTRSCVPELSYLLAAQLTLNTCMGFQHSLINFIILDLWRYNILIYRVSLVVWGGWWLRQMNSKEQSTLNNKILFVISCGHIHIQELFTSKTVLLFWFLRKSFCVHVNYMYDTYVGWSLVLDWLC